MKRLFILIGVIAVIAITTSCNVIYKYAHIDKNKLEKKVNRKLKGEFSVKVFDNRFIVYSKGNTHTDSITITKNCLNVEGNNVAYCIPGGVILIRLPSNCIDTTIIAERSGILVTKDGYELHFRKRYETFHTHRRLIKISELFDNISYKIK